MSSQIPASPPPASPPAARPGSLPCPLCDEDGGETILRDAMLRVVLVDDADYPGFIRVIWNAHVAEMSDLAPSERAHLLEVVLAVETALRAQMAPHKINLASLGNQVPHLHWHVVPRYLDDAHFPQPIWGARQRDPDPATLAGRRGKIAAVRAAIIGSLAPA
jgi:diadenosine tetraphosphate (Ap4A) HIT family hydrolase